MPLRSYRPTSPGLRGMTRSTFEEITTKEPYKPLLEPQKRGSGRNNQGRLTVRHRGGGEKQHYRRIDFKRDKVGVPAKLATIEYDPNRSARIGLLHYRDGEKRYMLLPHGMKVGDVVVSGPEAEARVAAIVSDADGYAQETVQTLAAAGIRVEADTRNEKINYKVREHSVTKVPVILVVGKREMEEGAVNMRRLGSQNQTPMKLAEAVSALVAEATPPDLKRE